MLDLILKSYISDFAESFGISKLPPSEVFERFASYCVVSKAYPELFLLDDVIVGAGNDTGIDGLAIIVNGRLVTSPEEVDDLKKLLGRIDVQFIFIQAKTSPEFDMGEIAKFLFGVKSFFNCVGLIPENDDIKRLRILKDHIFKGS